MIREVLRLGRLKNLKEFCVTGKGNPQLTRSTAERLIYHCEHLKLLGHLKSWNVSDKFISRLRRRMKDENLDLEVLP
jgi:IS4 transposase